MTHTLVLAGLGEHWPAEVATYILEGLPFQPGFSNSLLAVLAHTDIAHAAFSAMICLQPAVRYWIASLFWIALFFSEEWSLQRFTRLKNTLHNQYRMKKTAQSHESGFDYVNYRTCSKTCCVNHFFDGIIKFWIHTYYNKGDQRYINNWTVWK